MHERGKRGFRALGTDSFKHWIRALLGLHTCGDITNPLGRIWVLRNVEVFGFISMLVGGWGLKVFRVDRLNNH